MTTRLKLYRDVLRGAQVLASAQGGVSQAGRSCKKEIPSQPGTVLYGKIVYHEKQIGEKPEKSEKSPEKSKNAWRKALEKSAADVFFHTIL